MSTNSFEGGRPPQEKISRDLRRQLENSAPPALREMIEDTQTLDQLSKRGTFAFTVPIEAHDLEPDEVPAEMKLLKDAWQQYVTIEYHSLNEGMLTVRFKLVHGQS